MDMPLWLGILLIVITAGAGAVVSYLMFQKGKQKTIIILWFYNKLNKKTRNYELIYNFGGPLVAI